MPSIRQPKRLEDMALYSLGDWIALQAENMMLPMSILSHKDSNLAKEKLAMAVQQIRMLLEYNVPWMLFDKLGDEVFRSIYELLEKTKQSVGFRVSMAKFVNKMNIAVTMTEVLLTRNLTKLTIDHIPKMVRSVFYGKLAFLPGLQYLNLGSLSGGWKTADMEPEIIYSLKNLHHLKFFCIHYDCTDNILKAISENCPKLQGLDLSCSKSITNDSISILIKCKNIKSVQLYRTQVTLEGYAKLLTNAKNLQDVGRCDEIGKVLEYINLTNFSAAPFMLTNYVSRYAPISHLQLAVEMCPYIQQLTIFHNSHESDLTVVIGLSELKDLKFLSCDFYADQIKQILQVKGCNISKLHLEHVDQIDLNALMYISQMCPMLHNFTIYNCVLIHHTSLYTRKLEVLPFRNLKRLTLVCECTSEQLLFILENCLNVQYIHLGTAVQITDDIFEKVLDKNLLVELEELRIMHSEFLTMTTVDRLLTSCLNLRVLVELECWSMLTDTDRDYVRNYIKVNNLDLDTTPVKRFEVASAQTIP